MRVHMFICVITNVHVLCVYAAVHDEIMASVGNSLPSASYSQVQQWRSAWQHQRNHLSCALYADTHDGGSGTDSECLRHRLHVVTMASDVTPGLNDLLLTSKLAGVEGEVLYYMSYVCSNSDYVISWVHADADVYFVMYGRTGARVG
jgi:hypothetical protein